MPQSILFRDARAAQDLIGFAGRATLVEDGLIRLRASAGVLAISAAALAPSAALDESPTVLALRFAAVDPELVCDLVVSASALTADEDALRVLLPETASSAPWAGISPPQRGWSGSDTLATDVLARRAQWGITEVARSVPRDAGSEMVHTVRAAVWGEPDAELADLPRGVAFAAHAFGFIGGSETAAIRRAGPWMRLSLNRGHILTRQSVRTGLTPVRVTGR